MTKTALIICAATSLLAGCMEYQIVFSDPEKN